MARLKQTFDQLQAAVDAAATVPAMKSQLAASGIRRIYATVDKVAVESTGGDGEPRTDLVAQASASNAGILTAAQFAAFNTAADKVARAGAANTLAPLDGLGRVPVANLPEAARGFAIVDFEAFGDFGDVSPEAVPSDLPYTVEYNTRGRRFVAVFRRSPSDMKPVPGAAAIAVYAKWPGRGDWGGATDTGAAPLDNALYRLPDGSLWSFGTGGDLLAASGGDGDRLKDIEDSLGEIRGLFERFDALADRVADLEATTVTLAGQIDNLGKTMDEFQKNADTWGKG